MKRKNRCRNICGFFELFASFHIYKGLGNVHVVRFDDLVHIAILVRKEFLINYSCMYYLDLIEKVIVRLKESMVKSSVKLKLFSKRFLILLTIFLFISLFSTNYLVLILTLLNTWLWHCLFHVAIPLIDKKTWFFCFVSAVHLSR